MTDQNTIIGRLVEYEAAGIMHTGRIIDKVRILGRGHDEGKEFDLYLIQVEGGRIWKVSPAAVKRILSEA